MSTVKYGVIPAGGLGTRFLPASAALPKEMFPIFDLPLISFAINDLAEAGVDHIFIVVSPWKKNYFESFLKNPKFLEDILSERARPELIEKINVIKNWPQIEILVQPVAQGLAQAINVVRHKLLDHTFFVVLPDEVLLNSKASACQQMLQAFLSSKTNSQSLVGLYEVDLSEVKNYGVAELGDSIRSHVFALKQLIEKPKVEDAPSALMLPGRYLFTSQFWSYIELELESLKSLDHYKEVHITDALNRMAQQDELQGCLLEAQRFDTGQPQGFLDLSIHQSKRFLE